MDQSSINIEYTLLQGTRIYRGKATFRYKKRQILNDS
jgi:hypothetical protein